MHRRLGLIGVALAVSGCGGMPSGTPDLAVGAGADLSVAVDQAVPIDLSVIADLSAVAPADLAIPRDLAMVADEGPPLDLRPPPDLTPVPPRLLAPMSTSIVTSQTPTLRWTPSTATVTVEICSNRSCTNVVATLHPTGTSITPTTPLTAGVYFWHALSSAGNSATWEFVVGALSLPVDTRWGSMLDVNGDGLADVAIGEPKYSSAAGRAFVYLGTGSGLAATPATTLVGTDGANGTFGISVNSAGDVNGDGFADLVVGEPGNGTTSMGHVYVYYGTASGIASNATPTVINGADPAGSGFGQPAAGVGDVDGDGYGDLLVASGGTATTFGHAYFFRGGPSGIATTPSRTWTGATKGTKFGSWVAGAGDMNGDGLADVAVGEPNASSGTGAVYVYYGNAAGPPATASVTLTPIDTGGNFGSQIETAGDVDGDGYCDLIVGGYNAFSAAGRAYVYRGGSVFGFAGPNIVLSGAPGNRFGWSVASAGDVNKDGYSDFLVGANGDTSNTGSVYLYYGANSVVNVTQARHWIGIAQGDDFGFAIAGAGDIDGDGYGEVVVGADAANSAGTAYVFVSGSSGPATMTSSATKIIGSVGNAGFASALSGL